MAEHVRPGDSEDDESNVYGDYRFEHEVADGSAANGFQLPPWTDPPTGEIPKVLAELDDGEQNRRSRFSSIRFPSLSGFQAREDNLPAGNSLNELDDEGGAPAPRPWRQGREGRPAKRFSNDEASGKPMRISSGRYNARPRGDMDQDAAVDGPENLFSPPPDEIELPAKRFNISVPKLSVNRGRHISGNLRRKVEELPDSPGSPSVDEAGSSDVSEQPEYLPSSYESRKDRIHRSRADAPAIHSSAKRPLFIRVATGVGLGAVVLLGFHFGPTTALAVVTVGVVLAIVEFYDTMRRSGFRPAALLGIAATLSLMISTYEKGANGIALVFASMVVASMLWYLVGVIRGQPTLNIAATFLGFLWIGGLGSFAAAILRPQDFPNSHGVAFLIGAILATVANDTAAYLFGSWIGRHKLAPEISPTKSWEGLIAGAVASVLVSALIVSRISPWTVSKALILGIVVAVVAPLGDLSESMIKRDLQIKDMGKLLPGHGGMLDRIDGLLFVLPTVYYLLKVLHLS